MSQPKSNVNRNVTLFITCIRSEGKFLKFFALSDPNLQQLKNLERTLSERAFDLEKSVQLQRSYQLTPGSLCFVKSSIKFAWCRARVGHIDVGIAQVGVCLIDYGNFEIVPMPNVRELHDPLFQSPPLAIECILADVAPAIGVEWSAEAIRFCEEHLVFKNVSGYVVSEFEKLLVIRIAKLGEPEPFVQRLINNGVAKIEAIEAAAKPEPIYRGPTYKPIIMDVHTSHMVTISCIMNPQHFYVQLSPAEVELRNLMEAIEHWALKEEMCPLNCQLINTPCLAPVKTNAHHYFRAIIRDIEHGTCKVLLVDYGNIITQDFQSLCAIPKHFLTLPAQAISCTLVDKIRVNTETFTELSKRYRYLTCQVCGRSREGYMVRLTIDGQDISQYIDKIERATVQPIDYRYEPLETGTSVEVNTSFVFSPLEFYCQLTACKNQLDVLTSMLAYADKLGHVDSGQLMPNFPVAAKFTEDELWYRAKVIKADDIYNIEVFFVDYGNTDKVQLQDLRLVSRELLSYPVQAYKFALFDLSTGIDLSKDEVVETLENLTADKDLIATIKYRTEDGLYCVMLSDRESPQITVNEMLRKIVNEPKITYPQVDKAEVLYITSYVSPSQFYGQLTKFNDSDLVALQNEMTGFYSKPGMPSLHNPKSGDIVSAKYCEDEQFYRAKVISSVDNLCKVFFIDYGNTENVNMCDVHELSENFYSHPCFGLECILENCPATASIDEIENLMINQEIQVEFIKEISPGKWQVSLTGNYPGNSAILTAFQQCSKQGKLSPVSFVPDKTYANSVDTEMPRPQRNFSPGESQLHTSVNKIEAKTYDDVNIPGGSYRDVFVCLVKSPSEFYCQLLADGVKLKSMMENISKTYQNVQGNEMKLSKFEVGEPCCVINEDDGMWCRGKIVESGGHSCEVFYVDYGFSASVPSSKIRELLPEFFILTPQSLKCGLFNTTPVDGDIWSSKAIKDFSEMACDRSFLAQFVETRDDGTYLVNLLDIKKLTSDVVNKEFIKLGHGHLSKSNKLLVVNSIAASTSLEFPKPNITLEKQVDVTIVWVTKTLQIYCQLNSHSSEFRKMMDEIQKHYNQETEFSGIIDRPHAGMICIAQFSGDNVWYRAEILDVKKSIVTVFYVDYGNLENVNKEKVKYIPQDFTILPKQAIKCFVNGVCLANNKLQQSVSHVFEGESKCTFLSFKDDYYLVDLKCNGKNVVEELVQLNAVKRETEVSVVSKSSVATAVVFKSAIPKNQLAFERGQLVNIVVTYVESPKVFWCQTDETSQLDELMELIETEYTASSDDQNLQLGIGSSCVAKYSSDGAWYRAVVTDCPNDHHVEVKFVDYGNSEVLDRSETRALLPDFIQLPEQAFKCQLYGLPSNYDEDSANKFKELTENATELMAKIEKTIGDTLLVTLFDSSNPDDEVNVVESIFGAFPKGSEDMNVIQFPPPKVPVGTASGYVSVSKNPSEFYVQLASEESELEVFSEQLQDVYSPEAEVQPAVLENMAVSAACCALYSVDEAWYRATITDILDDAVTVLFVDYGNFDSIPQSSVREISSDLLSRPPFAIPCQLADIRPIEEDWSSTAATVFTEITNEALLEFTFVNQAIPTDVKIMKEQKSVADMLVDMQVAVFQTEGENKVSTATPSVEPESTKIVKGGSSYPIRTLNSKSFKAKISYADSYDKFYVTAIDWNDDLDIIMAEVEETYGTLVEGDNTLCLKSIEPNQPCAAKYSEDGAWYRAVVTSVDGDNVFVKFVDYGNSEMVDISTVKQLTPSLFSVPPFAVECSLAELCPAPDCESQITTKLQSLVDDEVEFQVNIINDENAVQLMIDDNDFVNMLVDENLAVRSSEIKTTVSVDVAASIVNTSMPPVHDGESQAVVSAAADATVNAYPERIISSSKLSVKICFVETWDAFYATADDWSEELSLITAKLEEQYCEDNDTSHLIPEEVVHNQLCVAKYSEDNCWYRAIVTSVNETNVTVNFVDYGNTEVTELINIRQVTSDLLQYPPFSIKCQLDGITLIDGKASAVTEKLQTFVDDEVPLEMEITEHSQLYRVKLIHDDDINFAEQLIEGGLAVKDEPSDRLQDPQAFKDNLQIAFVDESVEESKRYTVPWRLIPSGKISATVKHCKVSNGLVALHIVESHLEDVLAEQQEKLQTVYSDNSKSDLAVREREFCVAKFPEDSCWYRAVILERHDEKVIVKFIDYGNTEVINIDHIKELDATFSEAPNFCLECSLSGVKIIEGCEEVVEVKLMDIEGEIQLDLCDFNFKTPIACAKTIVNEGTDIVTLMIEEQLVKQVLPMHYAFDTFQCKVTEERVRENLLLYLFPLCLEDRYLELKESLMLTYEEFVPVEPSEICLSKLYVIKKDLEYLRVYINSFDDKTADVTCVDSGVSCIVPLSSISLLDQNFIHIPLFSLPCCLHGINTSEIQSPMREKLLTLVEGKVVTCSFSDSLEFNDYFTIDMVIDEKNILTQLFEVCDMADDVIDKTYQLDDVQQSEGNRADALDDTTYQLDDIQQSESNISEIVNDEANLLAEVDSFLNENLEGFTNEEIDGSRVFSEEVETLLDESYEKSVDDMFDHLIHEVQEEDTILSAVVDKSVDKEVSTTVLEGAEVNLTSVVEQEAAEVNLTSVVEQEAAESDVLVDESGEKNSSDKNDLDAAGQNSESLSDEYFEECVGDVSSQEKGDLHGDLSKSPISEKISDKNVNFIEEKEIDETEVDIVEKGETEIVDEDELAMEAETEYYEAEKLDIHEKDKYEAEKLDIHEKDNYEAEKLDIHEKDYYEDEKLDMDEKEHDEAEKVDAEEIRVPNLAQEDSDEKKPSKEEVDFDLRSSECVTDYPECEQSFLDLKQQLDEFSEELDRNEAHTHDIVDEASVYQHDSDKAAIETLENAPETDQHQILDSTCPYEVAENKEQGDSSVSNQVDIKQEDSSVSSQDNIKQDDSCVSSQVNIEQEDPSISNEVNIEQEVSSVSGQDNIRQEDSCISNQVNIKQEGSSVSNPDNIKQEDSCVSSQVNIEQEDPSISFNIEQEDSNVSSQDNIKQEDSCVSNQVNIKQEGSSVSIPDNIKQEDSCVSSQVNIEQEDSSVSSQDNIKQEDSCVSNQVNIKQDGSSVSSPDNIKQEDPSISNEVNIEQEDSNVSNQVDIEQDSSVSSQVNVENRVLSLGKIDVIPTEIKVQEDEIFLAAMPTTLSKDFESFQKGLNDFYSLDQQSMSEDEVINGPCAVMSDDHTWHRGNVLAIQGDSAVVLYSDRGNGGPVDKSCIRKLKPQFMVDLPYIVWCTLQGFKCLDTDAVQQYLNDHLKNNVVTIEVLDEKHPYQIKFSQTEKVIEELLTQKLVISDESLILTGSSAVDDNVQNSQLLCKSELSNQHMQSPKSDNNNVLSDVNQNSVDITSALNASTDPNSNLHV